MKRCALLFCLLLFTVLTTSCERRVETENVIPEDVTGLVQDGEAFLDAKDLAGASAKFREAMLKNPKDAYARIGLAKVQILRGAFEAAADNLIMAARMDHNIADIYESYLDLARAAEEEHGREYYREAIAFAEEYGQEWFLDKYVPAEPVPNVPPGTYPNNTYISLSVGGHDEVIYGLERSDMQTMNGLSYNKPIRLTRGVNIIKAYSVRDGIPGKEIRLEYQCDYPEEIVHFEDSTIEAMVRGALGRQEGEITNYECEKLSELGTYNITGIYTSDIGGDNYQIHSLKDLFYFPFLTDFSLQNQEELPDLSPLQDTQINHLSLTNCHIKDISFLQFVPDVTFLYLNNNDIEDLSPVSTLEHLNYLGITENPVTNLQPVYKNESIRQLSLNAWQIDDLKKLVSMDLNTLNVTESREKMDLSLIGTMRGLEMLNLRQCFLTDISFVSEIKGLRYLDIQDNDIVDLKPLENLENLQSLNVGGNRNLSDITPLDSLQNLTRFSVDLTSVSKESINDFLSTHPGCRLER